MGTDVHRKHTTMIVVVSHADVETLLIRRRFIDNWSTSPFCVWPSQTLLQSQLVSGLCLKKK